MIFCLHATGGKGEPVHSTCSNSKGDTVRPWKLIFVFAWCAVLRFVLCVALLPFVDGFYLDLAGQAFQYLALVGTCLLAFDVHRERLTAIFGTFRARDLWLGIGLAIVLAVFINRPASSNVQLLGHAATMLASDLAISPLRLPLCLLVNVLMAATIEEFFFRGLLFPALAQRRSLLWSAVLCSMAFTFAHLGDLFNANAFLLSFALLILYARGGSLYTCITAHAGFNLLTMLSQYRQDGIAVWLLSAFVLMGLLYLQQDYLRSWRARPAKAAPR